MTVDSIASLRLGLGRDGRPVPAHESLGLRMQDVSVGSAVARLANGPLVADGSGTMLPGALAVLADTCCGTAVASALSGDGGSVTAQMRVEFVRPVPLGTRWVEGRGEADVADDEGGLGRGELLDDRDELLAVASMRALRAPSGPSRQVNGARPPGRPVGGDRPRLLAGLAVHDLFGVTGRTAGAGRAAWMFLPDSRTANSFAAMHGGVVAFLAHLVATDAQASLLGDAERLMPLDLVVNYYRAVTVGDTWQAAAEVTHRGRRFVVAEGEITPPGGGVTVRFSVGGQIRRRSTP
jgi:uncharacterized protein (TIGR00369 family)